MPEKVERRPFHETIVDAIKSVDASEKLGCLALLIKATKIPKNHDTIINAWKVATSGAESSEAFQELALQVVFDLQAQKREAEAEAEELAKRDEAILAEAHRRAEAEERALYGNDEVCDRSI